MVESKTEPKSLILATGAARKGTATSSQSPLLQQRTSHRRHSQRGHQRTCLLFNYNEIAE
eukprot:scaffold1994_cov156-Skeletonema_marinoi.AAC.5